VIAPAEASSNLARYDGVKYGLRVPGAAISSTCIAHARAGFGAEVKRRIMLGTYALSAGYYDAYYGKAQKVRTLVLRDFQRAFELVDVIVAPTTPGVAFTMGERADPLQMYLNDVFTIPCQPGRAARAVRARRIHPDGLPIGLQLIGKAFDEATLLRTAKAYEGATRWRERKPELAA
jgi:aspartyl-tRNA(Asn)/glutamyl-tRNA(Gln) amidotransferase subunit A